MKFLAAIIAYLFIGFILSWGILLAMQGKYWLLVISSLAYTIAFAKIGCMPPKETH